MDYEKLTGIVERQLGKITDYLSRTDGKLDEKDACYLDQLVHTMKGLKTIEAMDGYGKSERGRDSMGRFTRDGGNSYREEAYGGSYRNSYEGSMRSMHGDEREQLERMMRETKDERVRRAISEAMRNM